MPFKIFTSAQIREIDAYTIENEPVSSIDLMERAAGKCTGWILKKFDSSVPIMVFAGPGNNGGDGFAIARQLINKKYKVKVYFVKISDSLSADAQINFDKLNEAGKIKVFSIEEKQDIPKIPENAIVIDAIFGTGLSRPVSGIAAEVIFRINISGSTVVSIDMPSGLMAEDNSKNEYANIIKADFTLSFQFPKLAFFLSSNAPFTGEWEVLNIDLHPKVIEEMVTPFMLLRKGFFEGKLKERKKFSHKGSFGHALLIAGSYGKMGAAVLGAEACLRTGSGLITVHVPKVGCEIMQTTVPEAMISIDESKKQFSFVPDFKKYTAIGIGPGLGLDKKSVQGFSDLLSQVQRPIIVDADAINILAGNKELLKHLPPESILTPHPKEFERIAGSSPNRYKEMMKLADFACEHNIYVVLKGAYSRIACPDGLVYFNTTGNPGMATAGTGDALTGIILSLLAQDYPPRMAALLGVYLHGLAGDFAAEMDAPESMITRDLISNIGNALNTIKDDVYEE